MPRFLPIQPEIKHMAQAMGWYRLSSGLVGIFIPLVILQSGGRLLMVAGFYLLFAFGKLIADVPAMIMIQRRGVHFGLVVSFVCYAVQLLGVLGYAQTHQVAFLALGAISLALIDAFGDNARHMYVSAAMEHDSKSSSIATMEILGQIADFAGPLTGALIGVLWGADWLLVIALACLGFTVKPLTAISKLPVLDQAVRLRFTLRNAPARDCLADGSFGSEETVSRNLWPIYLAVVLGTYNEIGIVAAISALGTVAAVWLAGHRGDRGHDRSVLAQGVAGMSLINGVRLAATTFGPLAVAGAGYRIAQGYALNGLNATYYSHAKDRGLPYIVSIEIANDIGYVATWIILFAVLAVSDSSRLFFTSAFVIAAVVVWGTLLFTPYPPKREEATPQAANIKP